MSGITDLTADQLRVASILFPESTTRLLDVLARGRRFVHYTTAEVAASIIGGRAVWMRNALTMNDFSEVQHGKQCLLHAWHINDGKSRLEQLLEQVSPGLFKDCVTLFDGWLPHFEVDTFMTCLSEHLPEEDQNGRLSMWRAYGGRHGVALVMNTTPFATATNALAAYSSPVSYLDKEAFAIHFDSIVSNIGANIKLFKEINRDDMVNYVFTMLRFAVLCTKHPGFIEEKEWRVIYSPLVQKSGIIQSFIETVRGVPQIIQKIPLVNSEEHGLFGAAIPDLLVKVIIGPTDNQFTIRQAFEALLHSAGVENPTERIVVSGIPLRQLA